LWPNPAGVFGDPFSKPAVLGERAYVGTTGGILVLDLAEQRSTLRFPVEEGTVMGKPLVLPRAGKVVCGTSAGWVYAFDVASDRLAWKADLGAPIVEPGVALDDQGLYVGFVGSDGRLSVFWTPQGKRVLEPFDLGEVAGPLIRRGRKVFFATKQGEIRSAEIDLGTTSRAFLEERAEQSGPFAFTVSADGKMVIVASSDGAVCALDASDLSRAVWQRRDPSVSDRGGAIPQIALLPESAAHPEQVVVLHQDGHATVRCLDGREVFERTLAPGTLSVAPECLIVSDERGAVHVFPRP
jgi:outer membrane protein assembly factor BamB